jgi:carboxyl-terminal processing protease
MAGFNWQAVHEQYRQKLEAAGSKEEANRVMSDMLAQLPSSHLAIIPEWAYNSGSAERGGHGSTGMTVTVIDDSVVVERIEEGSPARNMGIHTGWQIESVNNKSVRDLDRSVHMKRSEAKASLLADVVQFWLSGPVGSMAHVKLRNGGRVAMFNVLRATPAGKMVEFGNLPPEPVCIEHRKLPNGVGYIRLNVFLDPVSVMPEIETAVHDFRNAPAVVLDLRNNPGGLGIMAMGIAGWFVAREGLQLGVMQGRDSVMDFEINPRLEAYTGRLAILVNGGSASTTEILAQGLQDLGRARIFGTRTAGAALPSGIIELPDGDRFQYPEANYVSVKGRVLEGNGVRPDVTVKPTFAALLQGRDLALEAASKWGTGK